jgi:hypothetical protein
MIEKGNPNSLSHVTIKKMVHRLAIPLTHVASVHHNDCCFPEVIHGKDFKQPSSEGDPLQLSSLPCLTLAE